MYPNIEKLPGRVWMFPSCTMKLAIKGSRVSAKAGIIGSGNILVTKTTDTICPKANTIAIYMNETKCSSLIKLKIPQKL